MKRIITLTCGFAVCFFLMAGCINILTATRQPGHTQTENINLLVKIDVEKNGAPLDSLSSIAAKDKVTISNSCQDKQGDYITVQFCGSNIKKFSADSYSMDYRINLTVPTITISGKDAGGKDIKNTNYTVLGSDSSINMKSGQPACIFESNIYKVKMTVIKQ